MSIVKKFYPNKEVETILDISPEDLEKNNIKALLLDVDNTLIDYKNNILEGLEDWIENIKKHDIRFCILTNTNKLKKAERISKLLDIPYIYLATKPLKRGFKKAAKILDIKEENIGVVGDQIMTDVFGANRCKMYSILVKPISNKDLFITKLNRILEKMILKKYHSKEKK